MFAGLSHSRVIFHGSSSDTKSSVRIVPLGGSGNVTKNMYVYEYRYDGSLIDSIIIDCGVGFPEPDMYGVDLIVPDVRYLSDKIQSIRGIVFTHGHDDHIGGIPFILPKLGSVPMWGTKLASVFANIKLQEANISSRVSPVSFGETVTLGSFTVTFIRVTHSIPDTAHLAITTPIGTFYHGSDFKFDTDPLDGFTSDMQAITEIGRKGVLCLLTDCLGSEKPEFTPSEHQVGAALENELTNCRGKCLFSVISSNVSRIQLAINIALKYRRHIAFLGRSIDRNVEEALRLGYMHFPQEAIVRDRDLKKIPHNKQFLIVAGSQAQPESALVRIATDEHRFVHLSDGDTVIFSSDPIPGNETNINTLIDQLFRKGARVSYSTTVEGLHVSGHGSQGDLMELLSIINPTYVYPIGGSYRHIMQYRVLAEEIGFEKKHILIPNNGEILEFRPFQQPKIVEAIDLEQVMVDGLGVGDVGSVVLRDRQTIATDGIVVIIIPIEKENGKIASEPDIVTRGFVYVKESKQLLQKTKQQVRNSLRLKKGKILDWQYMKKKIEDSVGQMLRKETGRTPLIVPVIIEV